MQLINIMAKHALWMSIV